VTDDEARQQTRRGYWLRRARDRAGLTLSAAAEAAGLSAGSGSTVTHWEKGERPIKVIHLERLARAYGVPVAFFMRPERTDDERLDEAIQSASAAERADWAVGEDQGRGADDAPGISPGRRSA
jgi:transcriptional regulator with XRE-family HTH domain